MGRPVRNLIGTGPYGKLTPVRFVGTGDYGAVWEFRCECGGTKQFSRSSILQEHGRKSCGCSVIRRGPGSPSFKHGFSRSPTYLSWYGLKRRCYSKKSDCHPTPGLSCARVCDRWLDFKNFLADMGERPDGHRLARLRKRYPFGPKNCRWVPIKANAEA